MTLTMTFLRPIRRTLHDRASSLRLCPKQGPPRCLIEQFAQHVCTHKLAWLTLAMATLSVVLQVGLGDSMHRWFFE